MFDERQFRGNGLLVFSDPAGAKACLALAAILSATGHAGTLTLVSNEHRDFYADWGHPVTVESHFYLSALRPAPDWVFTGTSHPQSSGRFELRAIADAVKAGIQVVSFIDHWTNMALRFRDETGILVLPDAIWLLDEHARAAALADGLPADRIRLAPNPYLEYIRSYWRPTMSTAGLLALAGAPLAVSRFVLYAPDPVSLRNDDGEWGFDELSAMADLVAAMKGLPRTALLVKPHPLQPAGSWNAAIDRLQRLSTVPLLPAPRADNLELAAAAGAVVGFHSNMLLEAAAAGAQVLRYFPASADKDAIAHTRTGVLLTSAEQLRAAILNTFIEP